MAEADRPASFADFGLSGRTLQGLERGRYTTPTEIQAAAIPIALRGKDVLGASKTGSGKTLAFLIPILERLYHDDWTTYDGCWALVISPTRELAQQIFKMLTVVGHFHNLAAGLVIGGHNLQDEQKRLFRMAIVIGTPGRILAHMDSVENWDTKSVKILAIDEADRCMDMGFQKTIDAIIDNLPEERQTLLFSATQTKDLKVLRRLSMREPEYVAVHALARSSTPARLSQNYLVCPLQDKINVLYAFLKSHMMEKSVVFVGTCSMARFMFWVFSKLFRKTSIACAVLSSKMHQDKRSEVFHAFCVRPKACVLFCTDIAARGLDFPAVDWVVQYDCPGDEAEYIHRVGRTARIGATGKALTMFLPSEQLMIPLLQRRRIPLREVQVSPDRMRSMQNQLIALCVQFNELKILAQKAFVSYFRSVHFQSNKLVFDVDQLPREEFAQSLGLSVAPNVVLKGSNAAKNLSWEMLKSLQMRKAAAATKPKTRMERKLKANDLFRQKENLAPLLATDQDGISDGDDGEPFLKPAAVQPEITPFTSQDAALNLSKKKFEKILKKKAKWDGQRRVFDDDESDDEGTVPSKPEASVVLQRAQDGRAILSKDTELDVKKEQQREHAARLASIVADADATDKVQGKQRVRMLHQKKSIKRKQLKKEKERVKRPQVGVQLGAVDEFEDDGEEEGSEVSSGGSSEGSGSSDNNASESDPDSPPPSPKKKKRKVSGRAKEDVAARLQAQEAQALALLQP